MNWLKEKLNKFKKWIIGLGIVGIALAGGTALLPEQIPANLQLKVPKEKILFEQTVVDEKGSDIKQYLYVSDTEVPRAEITYKGKTIKEDLSRRTENSQSFKRETKNGKDIWETNFYGDDRFYKDGDKWYQIEIATTTSEAFKEQTMSFWDKILETVYATDYLDSTNDGYIYGFDNVYATARVTSTNFDATSADLRIGQEAAYGVWRGFLKFDTSAIPDSDNVTQVNLKMVCTHNYATTNFDVQIVKQDWSAQDPITAGNMEAAYDNSLAGTADDNIWRNTSGIVLYTQYTSGNLNAAWVSKTGSTYYSLRSSRDYGNIAPTGVEDIYVASQNNTTEAYRPVLTVVSEAVAGTVKVLVVAGGGGGGGGIYLSGGGGGGGLIYNSAYAVYAQGYTVTVGGGGAAGVNTTQGTNGADSVFGTITATGGGGGGNYSSGAGKNGGSGGGAAQGTAAGTGISGQGYGGGTYSASANYGSGGGGGAGAVGGDGTGTNGGVGGVGLDYSAVFGTGVGDLGWFAGGGGGSIYLAGTPGAGGQGGGGAGSLGNATSGTANTGGGGGGAERNGTTGGTGGSGIVIISYVTADFGAYTCTGGTITYSGVNTIHTFTSSGTFAVAVGTVKVLAVAGGGGGGGYLYHGAGGGAGGVLYNATYSVYALGYTVTVGGGGAGGVSTQQGTNGENSVFGTITATGGGGGANYSSGPGLNGGSGGGGSGNINYNTPGTGIAGQGFDGGWGYNGVSAYGSGCGGGAGAVGANGTASGGGNGGVGILSSISGTPTYYGGGGGGGSYVANTSGTGGLGGGGNGGTTSSGSNGTANTGGGGGGPISHVVGVGGNGGSGIVIISYVTADFGACTGGTITYSGIYTIHTFTSSGTFTVVSEGGATPNVEMILFEE